MTDAHGFHYDPLHEEYHSLSVLRSVGRAKVKLQSRMPVCMEEH